MTNQTSLFQSLYTAFAIDTTDDCGLNNKACHELLSKDSKAMLYFAIDFIVKAV